MSGVTIMRPHGHECEIGGANDRCVIPPYGIFGGMPGLHGENKIIHADGSETPIDRAGGEIARDGDVLYFRAPGGGGYGDPSGARSRPPAARPGYRPGVGRERPPGLRRCPRRGRHGRDRPGRRPRQARAGSRQEWRRDRIFIDQKTRPFARKPFRIVGMDEQIS